jgi:glycine/D-amino acid oxidase-like deaminating enzyme
MNILPEAPTSLWLDTYGPYTPESPLNEDLTVDIAIIGGGFTGLATAYELKRSEPALRIVLLEAQTVGYGASGRNGSFAMTVVGLGIGTTAMLRGKQFLKDAHAYMERAVDCTDELIQREDLDCDRIRPGFLRVATTMGYIKRLQHDIDLIQSLGFEGITWIDQEKTRKMVNSERYLGALWEPRLVLVNPLKMVREEKRVILEEGVQVFENSPVLEVVRDTKLRLKTPNGTVKTEKLVFATNAYSHLFPELRRKQIPAFTYMVATDPLTEEQLAPIGWEGQQGVEDARNLIHYYRLTPERRLVMGGGPVGLTYANDLAKDTDEAAWKHLEEHIHFLFPSLKKVALSYRWGGPFSVTIDLAPAMGYLGDVNVVYSLGCIGHGVSMSHLNGKAICDMLLERQSDLMDCPFINRRVIAWPPEPLRIIAAGALRGYLQLEDWYYERDLPEN